MKLRLKHFTVSGDQRPLTYTPALDTLTAEQIESAREDVRIRKIMLDNVNVWDPSDYIMKWALSTVANDLSELGR